jgi:hypothetical protein
MKMKLQKLSLAELQQLQTGIDTLCAAGSILEKAGLDPIFDLTPGEAVCIFPGLDVPPISDELPNSAELTAHQIPAPPAQSASVKMPTAGATGHVAGGKFEALAPGNTKDLVTGPLSDAERVRIVALDIKGMSRPDIAADLNRRVQTVALYLTALYVEPLDKGDDPATEETTPDIDGPTPARYTDLQWPLGRPFGPRPTATCAKLLAESDPIIDVPSGAAVLADLGAYAATTAAPLELDELGAHLASVPHKNGWTIAIDAELLRLACLGWQIPEIELELGRDGVKLRFHLLTRGKQFARDMVASRLALLSSLAA